MEQEVEKSGFDIKGALLWLAIIAVAVLYFLDFEIANANAKMAVNVVFLVFGFVMLIKGADVFVEAASKIALKLNIPMIVIGLTIVAFGTSLPEAAVSIKSAIAGVGGISIGNVVGSNIMNILLILGVAGCIANLPVKKNTFRIEIPFVILITTALLVFGIMGSNLTRLEGIALLVLLAIFMVYLIGTAKNGEAEDTDSITVTAKDTYPLLFGIVVIGAAFIVIGSNVTVDSASYIASKIGMSDRLIGLTIVAFGTSLPELVTSATAAKRGMVDIAIGNIVGSNIFNILFVLGACVTIRPIPFADSFIKDTVIAIVAAVILFAVVCNKDKSVKRSGAIFMLLAYAAYFVSLMFV